MTTATRCVRALMTTALLPALLTTAACDSDDTSDVEGDPVDEQALPTPPREVVTDGWELMTLPELADESAKVLRSEAMPETANVSCTLDTFNFRSPDVVALTSAPGFFIPPIPDDITTFNDPALADGFIIGMTLKDINGDVVGFGTEQEILDMANFESDSTYTITVPGRGTLMLKQRESFEPLIDTVNDMLMDGVLQRTFNPPLVTVTTLPGTGKVVGGAGEFANDHGIWQEIGIIHGIDLTTSAFDLEIVVQALHCGGGSP